MPCPFNINGRDSTYSPYSHIPTGACWDCRCLVRRICMVSGFAVTQPDRPISCPIYFKKWGSFC